MQIKNTQSTPMHVLVKPQPEEMGGGGVPGTEGDGLHPGANEFVVAPGEFIEVESSLLMRIWFEDPSSGTGAPQPDDQNP